MSPWNNLIKSKPGFELDSAHLSLCQSPSVCCVRLNLSWLKAFLQLCFSLSMCLCLPMKGILLCSLNSTESNGEGMRDTWQKSLTQFYKGLGHWLQITPTNPNNKEKDSSKQYLNAASSIYVGYLFYKAAFNLLIYLLFPAFITITCIAM